MEAPIRINVTIPNDAYLSLTAHGYCALMSENDPLGETIAIREVVNVRTESDPITIKCTMHLVARQRVENAFCHIYAANRLG